MITGEKNGQGSRNFCFPCIFLFFKGKFIDNKKQNYLGWTEQGEVVSLWDSWSMLPISLAFPEPSADVS
jgi:hypothetical protein